jgi:23S rRNA pseudouridine955/2504/2580 synthase
MSGVETVRVTGEEDGLRLDRWFKRRYPRVTHGRLEKWLRQGHVRVDGRRAKAGTRLQADQSIRVPPLGDAETPAPQPPRAPASAAETTALLARVLHKDDQVIILDKPAGMAVQGGTGVRRHLDAMLDALRFGGERPRLVHRLDKDTSGVMVLARTARAAAALAKAFQSRDVGKLYWAVVVGVPKPPEGRIDLALAKRPGRGGERVGPDEDGGLRAITDFRVIERAGRRAAWLALEPRTGRTHQLRAHCVALGTPILGDAKYGGSDAFLEGTELSRGLHLHARALRIPRPGGGFIAAEAPLPEHMRATWRFFGFMDEGRCAAAPRPVGPDRPAARRRRRHHPLDPAP